GALDQVAELFAHHLGAAHHPPDNRLVDDSPEARPVLSRQDVLPFRADLHSTLDFLPIQFTGAVSERLPGVLLGLEQAGHHVGLEVADGCGPGFQPDVDLVGIGQDVTERVPPAGLAGFAGQPDQAVAFRPGDAVELQQDPDVAGLGTAAAGLDAEDRGG